jgi:hypothetical protein
VMVMGLAALVVGAVYIIVGDWINNG